jgi:hypothetical protein
MHAALLFYRSCNVISRLTATSAAETKPYQKASRAEHIKTSKLISTRRSHQNNLARTKGKDTDKVPQNIADVMTHAHMHTCMHATAPFLTSNIPH